MACHAEVRRPFDGRCCVVSPRSTGPDRGPTSGGGRLYVFKFHAILDIGADNPQALQAHARNFGAMDVWVASFAAGA